jgi:hypothetical protein
MLTAIEGIYDNGQIFLKEKPLHKQRVKVFVMFTDEETAETKLLNSRPSASLRGAWKNANAEDKEQIKVYFDNVRNEWERDI